MADVKLVVGKDSYSAHSQILAYRSDLILRLLEGCPNVSPEKPLVISEALSEHDPIGIETLLKHVYQQQAISSHKEAEQLLSIANYFQAPYLARKAVFYMENTENLLQATCDQDGALRWLLLAEKFELTNFKQQCVNFITKHFAVLQSDSRMEELRSVTCVAVMRALQAKSRKHDLICPEQGPVECLTTDSRRVRNQPFGLPPNWS
ncbi:hypothetical protein ABBQ38_000558 [Trebouxia sp. C0009 RCD-2024]